MALSLAGIAGAALVTALVTQLVATGWDSITDRNSEPSVDLIVSHQWPPNLDLTCDPAINVAGLPGGLGIEKLSAGPPGQLSPAGDPRTRAIKDLAAVVWYRGELRLVLATNSQEPALVIDVELAVHKREEISPAWGLEFDPPCGGPSQYRLFRAVLDYATVEDGGVVGAEAGYGPPRQPPPSQPLGRTFTVSQNDPAELVFHVYACSGLYEWRLKITYVAAGQTRTAMVGTKAEPLSAVGGWRNVDRFHGLHDGKVAILPGPAAEPGTSPSPGPPMSAATVCPAA